MRSLDMGEKLSLLRRRRMIDDAPEHVGEHRLLAGLQLSCEEVPDHLEMRFDRRRECVGTFGRQRQFATAAIGLGRSASSGKRRVGKACVRTCRYRWAA